MTKEEIRDKVEDLYIKETDRFAFLSPNKLDDRYIEWLERNVVKNLTIPFVSNAKRTDCPACYGVGVQPGEQNGCYHCGGTGQTDC